MRVRAWWLCLLVPAFSVASTIIPHTLKERAARSDRVALAQVLEQRVLDEGTPEKPRLKTLTRLAMGQNVRGSGPGEITVVQLGGRLGPWDMRIPGDAQFVVGETALVFLRCPQADRCYLVALGEGRLSVVGSDVVYRDLINHGQWARRPLREVMKELSPIDPPGPGTGTGVTR